MFRKLILIGFILLLAAMACSFVDELTGAPLDEPEEAASVQETQSGDAVEMRCEEIGLPCSPEAADPAVLERGAELHLELKERLSEGESIESAREWLEGVEGMRVVMASPYSLVFILEGGLPVGVYDAVAATGAGAAEAGQVPSSVYPASFRPGNWPLGDVVGNDTSRENENRYKRALVLSPFEFEYMVPDVGTDAVKILQSIPDYRGRVDYLANDAVDISAFLGWEKYDVILYTGHGGTVEGTDLSTGKKVKTSFITAGAEQTSCSLQSTMQDMGLGEAYPAGIACMGVQVRVENIVGRAEDIYRDYLAIYPKFFTSNYSSGLEKSVMIFNGCMTFISDALPRRLAGSSSVYFGWDNYVLANFNPGVISALLTELARGVPSKDAFDEICDGGGCVDSAGLGATLRRFGAGDDLRIREIASSLHPLTDDPLNAGDKVPVYGYPGDGQVDEIPFLIEVLGVKFEQIADYTVRFEINGQEVQGEWKLDDPDNVERWEVSDLDTYRIGDRLVLPFDFQQDMPLDVVIVLKLPEGGESRSVEVAALARNPVLALQSTFENTEGGALLRSTVSAEVPLSLVEIQAETILFESIGQTGQLKYESFDVEIIGFDCAETSTVQDGDLPVQKAIFQLEDATNTGFGPPDEVILYPSGNITEWYKTSCAGIDVSTPPLSFWFANFAVASEDLFTDEGLEYKTWEDGDGAWYARFHRELDRPPANGEYTFTIREP